MPLRCCCSGGSQLTVAYLGPILDTLICCGGWLGAVFTNMNSNSAK